MKNAERRPKPPQSQLQATCMRPECGVHAGCKRDVLVFTSCLARVLLVFSSCSSPAHPWELRRLSAVATELQPYIDSIGLAVIQKKLHFPEL